MSTNFVNYSIETKVSAKEFKVLLESSGLGQRRPVADLVRLQRMLQSADLLVTARVDGILVGIARSLTDFSFCCYLSDLAVAPEMQGLGVGAKLVELTRQEIGPTVSLILNSVPESVGFYERIEMAPLPNCYWYKREY
jgi:GNAT superfamily N-acetyltransferase